MSLQKIPDEMRHPFRCLGALVMGVLTARTSLYLLVNAFPPGEEPYDVDHLLGGVILGLLALVTFDIGFDREDFDREWPYIMTMTLAIAPVSPAFVDGDTAAFGWNTHQWVSIGLHVLVVLVFLWREILRKPAVD